MLRIVFEGIVFLSILCAGAGIYRFWTGQATEVGPCESLTLYSTPEDCVAVSDDVILYRSRVPKGLVEEERAKMMDHIRRYNANH